MATKMVISGLLALLLTALYHTGVAAEADCLAKGNPAAQCARLTL